MNMIIIEDWLKAIGIILIKDIVSIMITIGFDE